MVIFRELLSGMLYVNNACITHLSSANSLLHLVEKGSLLFVVCLGNLDSGNVLIAIYMYIVLIIPADRYRRSSE